ncbi:MAG: hypothetical protein IKX26_06030 [Bacteroidales bacterium]|nr:hypothetical protein [Bacteroidales bacterium]
MKKFLLYAGIFWIAFFALIISLRCLWIRYAPSFLERGFIGKDIHYVVAGPSNAQFAWNDRIIPHSKNLCFTALSMGACYNTVKWAVEYNGTKIDTVCLGASFIGILFNDDSRIDPRFEEEKRLLDYDDFFHQFRHDSRYLKMAISSFSNTLVGKRRMGGGYQDLTRNKLHHPKAFDRVKKVKEMAGEGGWTEAKIREKCQYQIRHLRRIKEYCDNHNITLVILSTPVYKIDEILSDDGYRSLLKNELGDSTLIADYSNFKLPDDSYYADVEHVNQKGAEYFSKYIAEHGLTLQYAIDYCNAK